MINNLRAEKMTRLILSIVLLGLFFVPLFAEAQTVVRSGEAVNVDTDQVVEGNFYSLGSRVSVSGEVIGDWFALGNTVSGNGQFTEDVLLVARTANVYGSTTDDVRILALEATVADFIGGNLVVVANTVKVLSSAEISGDILLYANEVEISGAVGGDILGRAGRLRIDGSVDGSVDMKVDQLTLGDRAVIGGDVSYTSSQSLVRSQNATVEGDIMHTEVTVDVGVSDIASRLLMPFLAITFISLVAFLIFSRKIPKVVSVAKQKLTVHLLVGLAVFFFTPIIAMLFLVSGLGVLVGVAVLALYVLLMLAGLAISGPLFGALVGQYLFKRPQVDILTIVFGVALLHALLLVPFIGAAVFLTFLLIAVGALAVQLYRLRR